jgi:hypothetical protein
VLALRAAHRGQVGLHPLLHDLQPGADREREQPSRMSAAISSSATRTVSGSESHVAALESSTRLW